MTERPSENAAWPKTEEETIAYIREMISWTEQGLNGSERYGRSVYSMAYAAVATYNYVASTLGVTGFQASMADLEIVAQNRGLNNGFMIVNAEYLLYPQYDLIKEVIKFLDDQRKLLAPVARKKIAENKPETVHPEVFKRWEEIASLDATSETPNVPETSERPID